MALNEANECYVCMESNGVLARPCTCTAYAHEACLVESIHHCNKLRPITCAICKKTLPSTIQRYALAVRCDGNVLLVTFIAGILAALEVFLVTYTCGIFKLWESPIAVFSIGFVALAFVFVCYMLAWVWIMYCRNTRTCCWCTAQLVAAKQLITMHDGSTIAVIAKHTPCTAVDFALV